MSAFELDYEAIEKLEEKCGYYQIRWNLQSIPSFTEGIRIAIEEITKLIPVSRSKWSVRNKTHAKDSNWSKSEKMNLGFRILARGGATNKKDGLVI